MFRKMLASMALWFSWGAGAQHYDANYARDRAEIEDLQARYLFAMDWQDADAYAATFTEDGEIDWARGVIKGRDAIRQQILDMVKLMERYGVSETPPVSKLPLRLRHFITNVVIEVHGDHATSRSAWFEASNGNPERKPELRGYGHYEDELQRVKGRWLFKRRKIYNEFLEGRGAGPDNPVH